jgi:TetR/AcrR family transcriptional regulator, tetracycline repressor protein
MMKATSGPWSERTEPEERTTGEADRRLVTAALELLDQVGLDNLTMRRLADHLGVRSASLYWHVRDKDQLLDLIADEICGEIAPPPSTGTWKGDLMAMAYSFRAVLLRHRDAATVLANTLPLGPNRLRLADWLLSALLKAGYDEPVAARAGLLFTDYVTNFVVEETRAEHTARLFAGPEQPDALAAVRAWFESLPADQYPNLVRLAPHLAEPDADARFTFGLQVLLDGLAVRRGEDSDC